MINKHILHTDLLEMEGGIWKAITAPELHLGLPTVDHIIIDILIDISKGTGSRRGVSTSSKQSWDHSALVIWCKE